jgi:DNA-binding CsgD family transcriptional regulator
MRNRRMAERAAAAVVLWDGRSGGSSDMVARMVARDKPVEVVPWKAPHGQRRPVAAASRSKASVARQQARDRLTRVEEMVCAGASYASIAQALQISERQVQQIVKSSARASVTR